MKKTYGRRGFLEISLKYVSGLVASGLTLVGCGNNKRLKEGVKDNKALDTLPPKGLDVIKDQEFYDEILKTAYARMICSTCAQASLQGLLDLWDLPEKRYSWATAGYGGAIVSGQTTCGLLIGSSIAIGFRYGQGKDGVPYEFNDERIKATKAVRMLYEDFLKEFGSTHCQTIIGIDFSKPEDMKRFLRERFTSCQFGPKRCGVLLNFVMNRFIELTKEGKI